MNRHAKISFRYIGAIILITRPRIHFYNILNIKNVSHNEHDMLFLLRIFRKNPNLDKQDKIDDPSEIEMRTRRRLFHKIKIYIRFCKKQNIP